MYGVLIQVIFGALHGKNIDSKSLEMVEQNWETLLVIMIIGEKISGFEVPDHPGVFYYPRLVYMASTCVTNKSKNIAPNFPENKKKNCDFF